MAKIEWNPGKILQTSGIYWQSCALHAGVRLDVFTQIGEKAQTAKQVAEAIKADTRGTAVLLDALAAMGLLEKKEDFYSNTDTALKHLCSESDAYLGHMVKHHSHLVSSFSKLDVAIKSGEPVRVRTSHDEEKIEAFLMGMYNNALGFAPHVSKVVDLSDKNRLLDLGGGPGTYAVFFCKENPKLSAVIGDLPTTEPFAKKIVNKFGLSERISFQSIDFTKENIEGTYDVAWLSHILHSEGPESCESIIKKVESALSPGGMILIHEFILNDKKEGPLFPALFSLNMFVGTSEGRSYSERELTDMLKKAGFVKVERIPFDSPNDSGIMMAIKKSI